MKFLAMHTSNKKKLTVINTIDLYLYVDKKNIQLERYSHTE